MSRPTFILPEVIAFTVPEEYRDQRFVTTNHMFETDCESDRVSDTFSDDMSLLVKGDRAYSLVLGVCARGTTEYFEVHR